MGNKKSFFIIFLSLFLSTNSYSKSIKLGIFDTTNLEKYKIQNFIDLSESVGFKINYKNFAQIFDTEIEKLKLKKYDGIFFILGIEFLQGMGKSPLSHKILQIIQEFGQNSHKLIGFVLPPVGNSKLENKASIFTPVFARAGICVQTMPFKLISDGKNVSLNIDIETVERGLRYFSGVTKYFLDTPLEAQGILYNTTLRSPKDASFDPPNFGRSAISTTLPIKQLGSEKIYPIFPYGIYLYEPLKQNHIFICSSSLLTFSGISENFHVCPTNFVLRKQIHENIQELMWELNKIISQKNSKPFWINFQQIEKDKKPDLPKKIAQIGAPIENKNETKFTKKIAWMDIYEENNDPKITPEEKAKREKQQWQLVDCILKSGNDLNLWITLNPHMYYSPIARCKNKTEVFWNSLKKFTSQLKTKAKELKVQTPKILLGYEITNNIYPPNYPKNPAFDVYENSYFDIPTPLDENFWENEIKTPLKVFLEEWKKPETNNGISLGGIVLDLEMYCRRTTGAFLTTMGFEPETLQKYNKITSQNIKDLMDLSKTKQLEKYFTFLENEAEKIGKNLKYFFNSQLSNPTIACYAINISPDWFYKGFYKGLGTKTKPLQLLTFNSEFASHQDWLENQKIFVTHSSVLMLSKIKNESDFYKVKEILEHNSGIWFNKFSKFSEDPCDWIEASPMSQEERLKFFEFLRKN